MSQEIVLEVRCVGCTRPVTPQEVDWLMFRQTGIPIHNNKRCRDKAYARFYSSDTPTPPKTRRSRKKEVTTA